MNFGAIDRLDVRAPVTTSGVGARGFNLYDGSLRHASFDPISTTGDGAVGVQVSKPMPILEVRHDIRTSEGEGMRVSLPCSGCVFCLSWRERNSTTRAVGDAHSR